MTDRIIGAKAEDGIMLALEDLTGATRKDARQLLEMLEKDYGLFGDNWEE